MPSSKQALGSWAESLAEDFLRRKGYQLIARHFTSRWGELDLVVQDGEMIVAVEVRLRRSDKFGSAAESIGVKKLTALRLATEDFLVQREWTDRPVRIDVVAIDETAGEHQAKITHLENVG